jgi:AAA domain, putative AbiEii toxin, Type IV TA system
VDSPSTQEEALDFLEPRIHKKTDMGLEVRRFQVPAAEQGVQQIQLHHLDPATWGAEQVGVKLLWLHTVSLNGPQRFQLAHGTNSGALDGPPTSHWMAIEREPDVYDEVDQMVHAAFGKHLIIQTYQPPQLIPALGDGAQTLEMRQSTSPEAIEIQKAAVRLDQLSDGVQAFCGLVAAVTTFPHLLLLIDEPEAFLHPTLCRRLGANLARIARERDARLIAATHSADFLLGCVEEVPQTTVLRLDYRAEVASSYALGAHDVEGLSRDPLLRSADALQALFSRSAVVCEADSDRAFYSEINRRLLQEGGRTGAEDCEFLNAQNWQTTVKLAAPLRKAGVPTAVILDLDTLASETAWPELVAMGHPPNDARNRIHTALARARQAIIDCGRTQDGGPWKVKIEGLGVLTDEQRPAVEDALAELAGIGIFLVTSGELENWLSQFGCTNKQRWVTDMLSRLGASGDAAFVRPGPGDVWAFLEGVARWLEDPAREGLPAN